MDDERVRGEYACYYSKERQALVIERTLTDITFGPPFRPSGRALGQLLQDNVLLLSLHPRRAGRVFRGNRIVGR